MNVILLLLKSGEYVVSYSEELQYEPKVHLVHPHLIGGKTKVTLTPWPSYTDDTHVLLNSGDLLTVVTPTDKIEETYKKKVGNEEEFKPKPAPVLLSEDENVPDYYNDEDTEYEPRYVEE